MSVAKGFMFESDPAYNLPERKSGEKTKHRLFFFTCDTKFVRYLRLLVVDEKKETEDKQWVDRCGW